MTGSEKVKPVGLRLHYLTARICLLPKGQPTVASPLTSAVNPMLARLRLPGTVGTTLPATDCVPQTERKLGRVNGKNRFILL